MRPFAHRPHFLRDAATWRGAFSLRIGDGPRVLADDVTLAGDSAARRRGLLDRHTLLPHEALIVAPTMAVHTFGMRFPIDIAFVDRAGRVLAIARDVPPRRVRAAWGAFAAIETAAGRCRAAGLSPGDSVGAVAHLTDRD